MTVYLGTFGKVELKRQADIRGLRSTIRVSDVNVTAKRFSFEYEHGQLITGDKVQFASTDGSVLDFINGYTGTMATYWVYVDDVGGIRLYNSFANAVNGLKANAVVLAQPGNAIPIRVDIRNSVPKVLAQVNNYELNTERETVDTTTLSDEFRSRINTLMSGSGRMSCEWEYTGDTVNELPNYLVELTLRTKIGSNFHARFYLKTTGYNPSGVAARSDDEVFYDFDAVITACAIQFQPGSIVQITADFITTGPVQLKMNLDVPELIVQESGDDILLDQDPTAKLAKDSAT
jgi:hypothetical protein